VLVLSHPPIDLHDLKWIGGGHQELGKQRIRIERNRSDEPIEFLRLEKLLIG